MAPDGVVFLILSIFVLQAVGKLYNRPIIGIVSLDTDSGLGKTMISASYVKYLEQAGARVVPIRGGQPEEYYDQMVNWTNGILIPGGAVNFASSLAGRSARLIFSIAKELNDRGDFYPIWGTCMGFQLLCYLVEGENLLKPTDSNNASWPLLFYPGFEYSSMFGNSPAIILQILSLYNVTQNQHSYSILKDVFDSSSKLSQFFNILSTNRDRNDVEFISTVEAKNYPFYGVQWHPEKPNFNWNPNYDIDHEEIAVMVGQYMANFFVRAARVSSHRFPSVETESVNLIENYNHTYLTDGSFYDIYYID